MRRVSSAVLRLFSILPVLAALCCFAAPVLAAEGEQPWRIRFLEAAVVRGPSVLLGEVAVPVGDMPPGRWEQLAGRELWPSPPEGGRAVNMTRPRLQEAVVAYMNDLAPYCLFPGSMALQRGGDVLGRDEVHDVVVKALTPLLGGLPGESSFSDFRTPSFVFLAHSGQRLMLEPPKRLQPGRVTLRLVVREMDGKVVQRLTGSVFVDCWIEAPAAAAPLNKGDVLAPDQVTFVRTNLAQLRADVWDGRGGPWRILRPIGVQQIIYQTDLGGVPTVQKGSTVNLIFESGSVALSVPAEAMQDGVTGESIPVRNLQSKKQVYAIVRDAGTVVVKGRIGGKGEE